MANQHGPVKLQGTLGDITFFRNADGTYGAKTKSIISKERYASDPKFIRIRENNKEFGEAGKAGRILRAAFQTMITGADRLMVGRLSKQMMFCVKADTTSDRGKRTVATGDPLLINGFDFNIGGKLGTTLLTPFSYTVNRTTGATTITVPPFVPTVSLSYPQGATHFKIVAAAAEVDFVTENYVVNTATSTPLIIDNSTTSPVTLNVTLTANTTLPVYQVMAVHFYQEVNGTLYGLNNGGFDAVKIVNADV